MRKINTRDFSVATRTTSREINRRIALNLMRERQPISRADLARYMHVTRGVVSVLVQELIDQGVICEGATGEPARGRKPIFLHIRTRDRFALAGLSKVRPTTLSVQRPAVLGLGRPDLNSLRVFRQQRI